jgi:Txe/YoeB family toxin of Txe-Axe toxin-antitoxin module
MDILRNQITVDPYSGKALVGDLKGYYSVRLSYQDRIVYSIEDDRLIVYVIRAKTHYGD